MLSTAPHSPSLVSARRARAQLEHPAAEHGEASAGGDREERLHAGRRRARGRGGGSRQPSQSRRRHSPWPRTEPQPLKGQQALSSTLTMVSLLRMVQAPCEPRHEVPSPKHTPHASTALTGSAAPTCVHASECVVRMAQTCPCTQAPLSAGANEDSSNANEARAVCALHVLGSHASRKVATSTPPWQVRKTAKGSTRNEQRAAAHPSTSADPHGWEREVTHLSRLPRECWADRPLPVLPRDRTGTRGELRVRCAVSSTSTAAVGCGLQPSLSLSLSRSPGPTLPPPCPRLGTPAHTPQPARWSQGRGEQAEVHLAQWPACPSL
jgi:hypothetical protein